MRLELHEITGKILARSAKFLLCGLLLAVALGGPAMADDWRYDRRDGDWRRHHWAEERARARWEHRHYYVPPTVFVAPRPQVLNAPPPVFVAPQPGFQIILPINIR